MGLLAALCASLRYQVMSDLMYSPIVDHLTISFPFYLKITVRISELADTNVSADMANISKIDITVTNLPDGLYTMWADISVNMTSQSKMSPVKFH